MLISDMFPDEEWRQKAACSKVDPNIFFPFKHTKKTTAQAFSYCSVCEVRAECLHVGVIYGYDGIWGGSTYDQRSYLMSKNNFKRSQFTLKEAQTIIAQLDYVPVNIKAKKIQ